MNKNLKKMYKYVNIKSSALIGAIPFSLYSAYHVSIITQTAIYQYQALIAFLLSFFWSILALNIIMSIKNRYIATSIISFILIFLMLNVISLGTVGYRIKLEYFKLMYDTGLLEFYKQSGMDINEVYTLTVILLIGFVAIFSAYLFLLKKMRNKKISVFTILLLSLVILDVSMAVKNLDNNSESVWGNLYNESILFRPNLSKYFITNKYNAPPMEEKTQASTKIKFDMPNSNTTKVPNIVIVMAESLRADVVTKETMPTLSKLSGTYFSNNFSTSNGTFFSMFSVFYGLFPNYYYNTINIEKPTIISMANALGQQKFFYNSVSTHYAGIDKFLNPQYFDKYIIRDKKDSAHNDKKIISDFKKYFKSTQKPELHILITNSTHHDYYFNEKCKNFFPYYKGKIKLMDKNLAAKKI